MTVTVQQVSNTNTFEFWVNRTNELASAMTNVVVTTNSNTAVGDAAITGTYTSNALFSNTISVGNSSVNTSFNSPNTVQKSSGDYFLNANGLWTAIVIPVIKFSTSTSGTLLQEIDNYSKIEYGAVEYFIRINDNNANNYHATKILTFHNDVTAFSTEYGTMISNNSLGIFAVSTNSTHVILTMTPNSTNTTVNIARVNF
jgi:hypothetical protein